MSKIAFMTIIIALVAAILSPSVVVNTFAASSGDGNGGDGGEMYMNLKLLMTNMVGLFVVGAILVRKVADSCVK